VLKLLRKIKKNLSRKDGGSTVALSERVLAKRYLALVRAGALRGSYDAASTSGENTRHWVNADALSADAATSSDVRRTLRMRARYEVANNSYAKGIILTLANDCVGTGPNLQMLTDDSALNKQVEQAFAEWASEVRLAEKLHTMRVAKAQDGEAFAIMDTNPKLAHEVKLDVRLIEADRVSSPLEHASAANSVDGIVFDEWGNPVSYYVLKMHPGADTWRWSEDYIPVPQKNMIHVYRADRPGQHRGVPEITPALPLFAQLRRYTLAVVTAAETAAEIAGLIYTDAPPGGEADVSNTEPMDTFEAERNTIVTLPAGWDMRQLKAEQPSSTYAEFKKEILNEIARCLNMPYNIAACNSSTYNYASGRLDHQTYFKSIFVDRAFMAHVVLDRLLAAWLWEYVFEVGLVQSVALAGVRLASAPHQWFWDGTEHVDPVKESKAQGTKLANKTTTLAEEYAAQGRDWEKAVDQIRKEIKYCREQGVRHPADSGGATGEPTNGDLSDELDELEEALAEAR